jgi:hypothetical protein
LKTDENYNNNNNILKPNKNKMRTIHNSIDLNSINNYCYNDKQKYNLNKNMSKKLMNRKLIDVLESKSCSNRICKNNSLSFEKNKDRDNSNDICLAQKKKEVKQKLLDGIAKVNLSSNFD